MPQISPRPGPGRPRLHSAKIAANRDQILAAAAELFVNCGYAGTTTRDIADAAGIRQASLYYHFSGKEEMAAQLLAQIVRPSLEQVDQIEDLAAERGYATALYALVITDTAALDAAPHNIARLALLPDIRNLDVFKPYKATRDNLVEAYERLGGRIAGLEVSGILLTNLIEVVITLRAAGAIVGEKTRHGIAAAALRACGATHDEITIASTVSWPN